MRRPREAGEDVLDDEFVEEDYDYNAEDSFTARSQHVLKLVKVSSFYSSCFPSLLTA